MWNHSYLKAAKNCQQEIYSLKNLRQYFCKLQLLAKINTYVHYFLKPWTALIFLDLKIAIFYNTTMTIRLHIIFETTTQLRGLKVIKKLPPPSPPPPPSKKKKKKNTEMKWPSFFHLVLFFIFNLLDDELVKLLFDYFWLIITFFNITLNREPVLYSYVLTVPLKTFTTDSLIFHNIFNLKKKKTSLSGGSTTLG